ncbi:PEGA domain-containing protein, partial [Myxococcus sp. K15C18031901]|uniref:PEGA domain-containing protein n=1 Tax=Myxococcus dinghuensis TaxID=2906761 RepID=UPI0020A77800
MRQKTWIAVIVVGTLALNAMAYVVVRKRRAVDPVPPAPVATAPVAPPPVAPPATPEPTPTPRAEDASEGLARARRASGLAALEDRDYDKAVSEFTEALSLRKTPGGDLVELLRIATDLQSREHNRTQQAKAPREPPARQAPRTRAAKVASRAQKPEDPAVLEEARSGLLLVTSTPPGLVVQVDGKNVDMTPARLSLRVGTYRVVLAHGDRKLTDETVEIAEDAVRSVNHDLTEQLAPAPVAAKTAAAPPPAVVAEPTPAPAVAPPEPVATPAAASTAPTTVAQAAVAGK